MSAPSAIVVGAGIIGSAIAYHLARKGRRVTVLEAGEPGGLATRKSWAWINASWGNPEGYFRLRVRAMEEWRRVKNELPTMPVSWTGGLIWDLPAKELEAFAAQHAAWGYGIRRVTRREIVAIEPNLAEPPDLAFHVAAEGAAEPLGAALAYLEGARRWGAQVVAGEPVQAIELSGSRAVAVTTPKRRMDADDIVIAAGVATPGLAAAGEFVLPIDAPPGLLVHSKPLPRVLNGLVMAPTIHLRQTIDGRLVAGSDYGGGTPGDDVSQAAQALFDILKSTVISVSPIEFDVHTVGYRPTPADGLPAIGRVPGVDGLYIAVMHSGVTLAPAVGLYVTEMVVDGRVDPLIAPYGPGRFLKR